jgi:hypothetical protein
MLGPHNYYESSIIVDLRSEFDEIPEMQGVRGKFISSRRSSSEEISVVHRCRRGPRDRLVGGTKVDAFEYLEKPLS